MNRMRTNSLSKVSLHAALLLWVVGCYHVAELDDDFESDFGSDSPPIIGWTEDSDPIYDTAPQSSSDDFSEDDETPSQPDYCLSLDGDEDYLRAHFSEELFLENSWTIEAWFRYYVEDSRAQPILRLGDGNTSIGMYFLYAQYSNSLPMGGYGYYAADYYGIQGTETPERGQWNHIAFTYQAGRQQLFVNGVLAGESTHTEGAYFIDDDLLLGAMPHPNILGYLDGDIDDVRISHGVRYAENFTPPANYPIDGDTIVQWTFQDDGQPSFVEDTHTLESELVGDAELILR
ncbi:MAG: LamG domain-containing protein [Deltaproteobacteria bacterium]|nr:LamG domain-containing protein [Deltaproteobacteria bacterium]